MMEKAQTSPLQKEIDQLDLYDSSDFSTEGTYDGASRLFWARVFQQKSESEDQNDDSVYQLNKYFSGDKEKKLQSVLDEWRGDKRSKIWISDTLMADLNLPFFNNTPKFPRLVQAFFVGEGLPAFILTVYDKAKSTDRDAQSTGPSISQQSSEQKAEIHEVTVSAIKLLRRCLLDFCHCKFAILPLTLDIESLSVASLTKELKRRKRQFRQYYDGDLCLKAGTYKTLVSAAIALHGSSFLPYFLKTPLHEFQEEKYDSIVRGDDEELLLLDRQWRNVLHLFIEVLTRDHSCQLDVPHKSEFKVKVAILEAVRRVGVQDEIEVVSGSEDVECGIRRVQKLSKAQNRKELRISPGSPESDNETSDSETVKLTVRTQCSELTLRFKPSKMFEQLEEKPQVKTERPPPLQPSKMFEQLEEKPQVKTEKLPAEEGAEKPLVFHGKRRIQRKDTEPQKKRKYARQACIIEYEQLEGVSKMSEQHKEQLEVETEKPPPSPLKAVYRQTIHPKTASDKKEPGIRSVVSCSDGVVVMADIHNNKIKVLHNMDERKIMELQLHDSPCDLACISPSHVVVMVSMEKIIYTVDVTGKPKVIRQVETSINYVSVCLAEQGKVYAGGEENGQSIVDEITSYTVEERGQDIVDQTMSSHAAEESETRTVIASKTQEMLMRPENICVSKNRIFICSIRESYMLSVDLCTGKETVFWKQLSSSKIVSDKSGTMYAACFDSKCVLVKPVEGEWGTLLDEQETRGKDREYKFPESLCVNSGRLLVSWWSPVGCDTLLTVYDLPV